MKKIMPAVVLASGSGSNLQTIVDHAKTKMLDIDVRLVLSNKPDAFALKRAENAGIKTWSANHKDFASREEFDAALIEAIGKAGILSNQQWAEKYGKDAPVKASEAGCIVLAGYMRLLSDDFIKAYSGRILNIHPAILPSFAGAKGGQDAIDYGIKITGCTVHFVDEIVDHGAVIIQAAVPHQAGESLDELMERVHKLEHRIYPQAIQWLAEDRLTLQGRVVHLAATAKAETNLASTGTAQNDSWLVAPALERF